MILVIPATITSLSGANTAQVARRLKAKDIRSFSSQSECAFNAIQFLRQYILILYLITGTFVGLHEQDSKMLFKDNYLIFLMYRLKHVFSSEIFGFILL